MERPISAMNLVARFNQALHSVYNAATSKKELHTTFQNQYGRALPRTYFHHCIFLKVKMGNTYTAWLLDFMQCILDLESDILFMPFYDVHS